MNNHRLEGFLEMPLERRTCLGTDLAGNICRVVSKDYTTIASISLTFKDVGWFDSSIRL